MRIEYDCVFVKICIQTLCPQYFGNLHKLVLIFVAMKKWLLTKYLRNPHHKSCQSLDLEQIEGDMCVFTITLTMPANMHPRLHMSRL